ncbi:MAG: sugar ABC transporter substrate-binding protein [Nocardioidaceae bacterium]|nr:sugar ABC transporter substrate-binding protein [Nocardioidaceae bacterium]
MSFTTTSRVRRLIAGALAATVVGTLATACSTTSGSSTGAAQEAIPKEDIVLVASVINLTNPYMASMVEGAKALSAELDVPLKIVNSNGSSQTEISQIQAILAEGKKVVLMVNTVASSDAPPIVNAVKAAGGYVTIWWNKPDDFEPWTVGDNFVAFQKHPGVESGRCTGDALADGIGDEGNIIALPGVQDSTTSQTRVAGLEDALKDHPNVKLLEQRPANWDQQIAFKETQSLLAKYGDEIDGVWAADDAMMLGAIEAVKKAGRIDDVKFASDGLYPPTIEMMKSGMGDDAIVGETFHRGYMAAATGLYTSYLAATGELKVADMTKEQRNSLFKISCVTPENLDEFTKYDTDVEGWVKQLVENGPFDTEPATLIGQGPEKLPGS